MGDTIRPKITAENFPAPKSKILIKIIIVIESLSLENPW